MTNSSLFVPAAFRIPVGITHVCAGGEPHFLLCRQDVYAWNGHGRIRFRFHGCNSTADVDRIAPVLRQLWEG